MKKTLNVFFSEHALTSYTSSLTRALSEVGVNINLFTLRPKLKELEKYGVKVRYFPFSKAVWLIPSKQGKRIVERSVGYKWLLKKLRELDINILHTNTASKAGSFIRAKEKYKIPLVYTNHYVPEPEPFDTLDAKEFLIYEKEKILIPHLCEHSSKVVTVSKYARDVLKREFGIDSTFVYHGVDLEKYNPSLPRKRKSLGLDPDEKIVLWVARFGNRPYKDPFTFLKAMPLVLKQCPNTRFVMIGKGSLEPHIIDLAKKLSVYKHIKIINYVNHLNLFYATSDVFVLPTFNDNFGLVAAEAMGCGKPVIVSNRGASQEFVKDAGLIFEYGSHVELSDKIVMLLEDEDLRQKLGAKAHKRIVENFTWEKAARKYEEIYKKVL